MIGMITGPPPTTAALVKFDSEWNGISHQNICVKIVNGTATVSLNGFPDYIPYYTPPKLYTQFSETDGHMDITTPQDRNATGVACFGAADQ